MRLSYGCCMMRKNDICYKKQGVKHLVFYLQKELVTVECLCEALLLPGFRA